MNKERRKELSKICKELQVVNDTINDLDYRIECELDAENDGFNNLTEGLQATARGQIMEEAADAMDDARRALKNAKKGYSFRHISICHRMNSLFAQIILKARSNYSPSTSCTISTASSIQPGQLRSTFPVSMPFNSLQTAEPFFSINFVTSCLESW